MLAENFIIILIHLLILFDLENSNWSREHLATYKKINQNWDEIWGHYKTIFLKLTIQLQEGIHHRWQLHQVQLYLHLNQRLLSEQWLCLLVHCYTEVLIVEVNIEEIS